MKPHKPQPRPAKARFSSLAGRNYKLKIDRSEIFNS